MLHTKNLNTMILEMYEKYCMYSGKEAMCIYREELTKVVSSRLVLKGEHQKVFGVTAPVGVYICTLSAANNVSIVHVAYQLSHRVINPQPLSVFHFCENYNITETELIDMLTHNNLPDGWELVQLTHTDGNVVSSSEPVLKLVWPAKVYSKDYEIVLETKKEVIEYVDAVYSKNTVISIRNNTVTVSKTTELLSDETVCIYNPPAGASYSELLAYAEKSSEWQRVADCLRKYGNPEIYIRSAIITEARVKEDEVTL